MSLTRTSSLRGCNLWGVPLARMLFARICHWQGLPLAGTRHLRGYVAYGAVRLARCITYGDMQLTKVCRLYGHVTYGVWYLQEYANCTYLSRIKTDCSVLWHAYILDYTYNSGCRHTRLIRRVDWEVWKTFPLIYTPCFAVYFMHYFYLCSLLCGI